MRKKSLKFMWISVMLMLFSIVDTTFALTSDEEQPVHLSSDKAVCKRQSGTNICTYTGSAKFNQGATNLEANQITIHKVTGGKINKIVASGKHSHYSTILDNKQAVNADADLITIYPGKKLMVLEGDGQVLTGQDKYSGPYIEYKVE